MKKKEKQKKEKVKIGWIDSLREEEESGQSKKKVSESIKGKLNI